MIEKIGETIILVMIIIAMIFFGGLIFGAGNLFWWSMVFIIVETILSITLIFLGATL